MHEYSCHARRIEGRRDDDHLHLRRRSHIFLAEHNARRRPQAGRDDRDQAKGRDGKECVGKIPQVAHTYKTFDFVINEHQVAMAESTFGGRKEAENPDALLEYWDMMRLAGERPRTAREAIRVMTELVGRVRLSRSGRVDFHRRRQRGLDFGDRRHGPGRQGRRFGWRCGFPTGTSPATPTRRGSASFRETIRTIAYSPTTWRVSPSRRAGTIRNRAGRFRSATLIARRRQGAGGFATRGYGASCAARRRPSGFRPITIARDPARNHIRCRCRRTRSSRSPTSSP